MPTKNNFNYIENVLPEAMNGLNVDKLIADAEKCAGLDDHFCDAVTILSSQNRAGDELASGELPTQQHPDNHPTLGEPTKVYEYRDATGQVVTKTCRFDMEENGEPCKEIRIRSLVKAQGKNNQSWKWKAIEKDRPLYNLPELLKPHSGAVYITEGEKAADALSELSLNGLVTTMSGGAKAYKKTDLEPLRGRDVVIFPDNDEAGLGFARGLGDSLLKLGVNSVKVLDTKIWGTAVPQDDGEVTFDGRDECPSKWDAADAVKEGWTAKHFEKISEKIRQDDPKLAPYRFPKNWRFIARGNEVFEVTRRKVKEGGVASEEYTFNPVFSRIEVLGSFEDNSGKSCGRVVSVCGHDIPVYHRDLMGRSISEVLQNLADCGLKTTRQSSRAGDYLKNYVMFHPNDKSLLLVTNPGWQDEGVFATPTWVAGTDRGLIFDCDSGQTREFEKKGSHVDWKRNVGRIAQPHNNLVLAISIALTGPLLKLLDRSGFGIHFYGPSSTGKSTLSYVATSVWGPPGERNKTWNATNTALEVTATAANDCLLCLDEINQGDPAAVYKAGYELANGQGRGRGTAQGGIRDRRAWRATFISNGEVPFSQYAKSASGNESMAGQETRILDIPVDAGTGLGAFDVLPDDRTAPQLADAIKLMTGEFHGVAAEAYVNALVDGGNDAVSLIKGYEDAFKIATAEATKGADGQVDRVAGQFALIAAAGEFAIKAGVVDWEVGRAQEAAVVSFKRWIAERGSIGSSEDAKAIENANSYLSSYGASRFAEIRDSEIVEPYAASHIPNLAGYWYSDDKGDRVYLMFRHVFKEYVCKGLNDKQVCRALKNRGLLTPDNGGKNTRQVRIKGRSRDRYYVVKQLG